MSKSSFAEHLFNAGVDLARAKPDTHYVPAFTSRQRGREQAVCGVYIDPMEFSIEPSCPLCAKWLADDDAAFASVADLGPAEHPVKAQHFDPCSDYVERRR